MVYKYVIPTPKNESSGSFQLGVSFVVGYVAGVLCVVKKLGVWVLLT
ncbi:hypothetical protein Hanom_Chr01g00041431 [Helianthus anomalus]